MFKRTYKYLSKSWSVHIKACMDHFTGPTSEPDLKHSCGNQTLRAWMNCKNSETVGPYSILILKLPTHIRTMNPDGTCSGVEQTQQPEDHFQHLDVMHIYKQIGSKESYFSCESLGGRVKTSATECFVGPYVYCSIYNLIATLIIQYIRLLWSNWI